MMDCYTYARSVALQYGHQLPDIGKILDNAAWACRKADVEIASDYRWVDGDAEAGALILGGPAPDKLHHCGVFIEGGLITHRSNGRIYTHSRAEFARMGYHHSRVLRYRSSL